MRTAYLAKKLTFARAGPKRYKLLHWINRGILPLAAQGATIIATHPCVRRQFHYSIARLCCPLPYSLPSMGFFAQPPPKKGILPICSLFKKTPLYIPLSHPCDAYSYTTASPSHRIRSCAVLMYRCQMSKEAVCHAGEKQHSRFN